MVSRKYKEELRGRGVEVIATNAQFDVARPEGKFAERMMEAVDEFTLGHDRMVGRCRSS